MADTTRARRSPQRADGRVEELVTAFLTASRVLVGISASSLADLEGQVTVTQFRTLVVLDTRDGTNLNGLADELGVNASTAMRTVDRLVAAALVSRVEDPTNRRRVVLALTGAGRKVVREVTARRRRRIATIVARMPATKRAELIDALTVFADAAGEPQAGGAVAGLDW